ncbi:MAG: pyrroline-5-carboxylate reductase dimerization domain-containing protein [Caulobacteraceae bacterium]
MANVTPILLLGAGRMGGALMEGWKKAGAFAPADLIVLDPPPFRCGPRHAAPRSIRRPPPWPGRQTVLLAVKPQLWKAAAADLEPHLAPDAVIVSIAAGVSGVRHLRRVGRTAGGAGDGRPRRSPSARAWVSLFAPEPEAHLRAHALFDPVATVVDLAHENLMHAATAVSGSAPAYLYAFIEALEAAGVASGLSEKASRKLARATIAAPAPCWKPRVRSHRNCAARSPRPAAPPRRRSMC